MGRAPCCDKANVKKGPWSPEEDATLKDYIEQQGTCGNWIALPQKIGLKRCGKSCRLRWLNYLRPNIKHGEFSEEEDKIISNLYISIGSRWSIIAAQLPGRTDNDIKNYWNTKLKKKLLGKHKDSQSCLLTSLNQDIRDSNNTDDNSYSNNTLSQSAIERLQLHMQLQNFHNPFSFYNNPALWPKLHPLGDKTFQDHHDLNGSPTSFQHKTSITNQTATTHQTSNMFDELPTSLIELERGNSINIIRNPDDLEHELFGNSSNGFSPFNTIDFMTNISKSKSLEQLNMMNLESVLGLQAELSELLNYDNGDQASTQFDCFKEMDGSSTTSTTNDTMKNIWLSDNDIDTKSSSSSWEDSASGFALQTDNHQGLFQDYVLEYDL